MNLHRSSLDRPNIDRPMASLFFEIKRNLPYDARSEMKLAAPDVGDRLVELYQSSSNPALRTLIEKFFARADKQWAERLKPPKKSLLMFYRRQA